MLSWSFSSLPPFNVPLGFCPAELPRAAAGNRLHHEILSFQSLPHPMGTVGSSPLHSSSCGSQSSHGRWGKNSMLGGQTLRGPAWLMQTALRNSGFIWKAKPALLQYQVNSAFPWRVPLIMPSHHLWLLQACSPVTLPYLKTHPTLSVPLLVLFLFSSEYSSLPDIYHKVGFICLLSPSSASRQGPGGLTLRFGH